MELKCHRKEEKHRVTISYLCNYAPDVPLICHSPDTDANASI